MQSWLKHRAEVQRNRGTRMEKHGYLGNKIGADKINEKGNSQER